MKVADEAGIGELCHFKDAFVVTVIMDKSFSV